MRAPSYNFSFPFSIGFKLAKYDRGPDSSSMTETKVVKVSPSGRIIWSPQMLQKLQEARQTALQVIATSKSGISLNKAWQTEFKKSYPDLNVDWKTVLSRYNYHFGNLDTIGNAQLRSEQSSGNAFYTYILLHLFYAIKLSLGYVFQHYILSMRS